ncbi:GerAB/ArcD/ProY family transporter [Paenibacillus radicis (ex Xue et al. 2023)]|uniref:Spore germination protein n=1 Tax=Paenibacillus radicis (ex Xue et al. 2023) TaxID=2972489 RepID=A0ABT1Y9Y6_9BACL|nr:spore germination protein [Paenibacillus radicis (ex Xue et al. 2023)]MCR8630009.1 spore germination protein [Paenibacillus radicis (ex Xue et al. 2023)]
MKKYAFNEITLMQYIFLNSGIQISVTFLSLPRKLAEQAGTDGWIALLLGWILSLAASLILIQVMKRYPDDTLLDLLTSLSGKWIGRMAAILLTLYFLFFGYEGIVRAILVIKIWVLPQTPNYLIMIILLIPAYLIARNGFTVLGRYGELVILISLWIPFIYLAPIKEAHWLHLLPVLKEGWMPILSALPATIYSFVGFASTFILYPFLRNKRRAALGVVVFNTMSLLTYLFITAACFVYFSPDEISEYNEPVITYLKAIEFRFIERIEILFITFYLFIFSLAWIPAFSISAFCTNWLVGRKDSRGTMLLLCGILVMTTYFFMPSYRQSEEMKSILSKAGLGVEYILPACLLVYIWIHDRFLRRKAL